MINHTILNSRVKKKQKIADKAGVLISAVVIKNTAQHVVSKANSCCSNSERSEKAVFGSLLYVNVI